MHSAYLGKAAVEDLQVIGHGEGEEDNAKVRDRIPTQNKAPGG